jgi:hypothetical protein
LLIDVAGEQMWDETILPHPDCPDDGLSPADALFRAIELMVRHKIRTTMVLHTAKRDGLGVLLYNTRLRVPIATEATAVVASSNLEKVKSTIEDDDDDDDDDIGMGGNVSTTVHEFIPLQPPGVATVLQIREVQDDLVFDRRRDLQKEYAPVAGDDDDGDDDWNNNSMQNSLLSAILRAMEIFQTSKCVKKTAKVGENIPDVKQIWIFTANDNPCAPEVLRVMQTTIQDAKENGVEISVWPLPKKGVDGVATLSYFDYRQFYDVIQATKPLQHMAEGTYDLQLLQSAWKTVRRAFTLPLLLPDWRENPNRPGIALDVYRLVLPSKIPNKVPVHQSTGR